MSNQEQKNTISFLIKGIEVLDFSLCLPAEPLQEEIKIFNFNINAEQKINIEQKFIFNIISVDIFTDNYQLKLGSFKSGIIFEIANFDEFLDKKKQIFILPDEMSTILNSISISTTRGLMFSHFKGTLLHNAFLPVIDPMQLKKQEQQ